MNNSSTFSSYTTPIPSIPTGQVVFGDGSNLMTSSSEFVFNLGTEFKANVGNAQLNIQSGISQIGDVLGNVDGAKLVIKTDDTHIAYYDNTAHTGLFGINTSTPSVALDVVGDVKQSGGTVLMGVDGVYTSGLFGIDRNTFGAYIGDFWEIVNGTRLLINDDNNLGYFKNTSNNANFGINTSTPYVALDVVGSGRFQSGQYKFISNSGSTDFRIETGGGDAIFNIDNTGNKYITFDETGAGYKVGMGTATPTEALDVTGNILASGTITPSDLRYKKNINPIYNALGLINSLSPKTYEFRQDNDRKFNKGLQFGLIAQEVEKVIPEVVTTNVKGYKGINYTELIPVLIGAIQEQDKRIKGLESEVKKLTKK